MKIVLVGTPRAIITPISGNFSQTVNSNSKEAMSYYYKINSK